MIKAIIFDYDGVIADSVLVKTEAFADMFKQYGQDVVKQVVDHHEANGGVSRFEKIKKYYEEFVGIELSPEDNQRAINQFSSLVLENVIKSPLVPGIVEFLEKYQDNYAMFISTGTPTEEMNTILKQVELSQYFKGVYGSPEDKVTHIDKIMRSTGYKPEDMIFIGDALTDRDAARARGLTFIGRYTTNPEILEETHRIEDFIGFKEVLEKL